MAINFPDAPTTGDTHTVGDKTWTYDGTAWNVVQNNVSDHGNLDGLADDDHTQYLLADGTRAASSLTVIGGLNVDTSTLHVDSTNNRVGIGTTSPAGEVHVFAGSSGVTTQNPAARLIIEDADTAGIAINTSSTGNGYLRFVDPNSNSVGGFWYSHTNDELQVRTAGSDRLKIDSSGHVTMPYQPCFYAYVGGTNPSLGAGWVVVPLNSELFDNNSDFNTSTYRFVAPVSGKYLFTCTFNAYNIDVSQNGSQFVAAFYKNGTEYNRVYQSGQYTTATNDRNGSGSSIISLAANDYVELRLYSPDTSWQMSAGAVWNSMSGFLIG